MIAPATTAVGVEEGQERGRFRFDVRVHAGGGGAEGVESDVLLAGDGNVLQLYAEDDRCAAAPPPPAWLSAVCPWAL